MPPSSSDEGEIADDGATHMKATSMPRVSRSGVDRQDRLPNRHASSDDDSASNHNSNRSSRGYKRGHDDYSSRDRYRHHDSRYSRDDHGRDAYKRSRVSYDDIDTPSSSNRDRSRDRYRDRHGSSHRDRRPRSRSRSPHRRYDSGPGENRAPRDGHRDRRGDGLSYDDTHAQRSPGHRQSEHTIQLSRPAKNNESAAATAKSGILKKSEPEPEPEQDQNFDEQEAFDEDAEIERRRKRREALLAKSSSATPLLLHAVGAAADKARAESPASSTLPGTPQMEQYGGATPSTPQSPNSPARLDLASDFNIMNVHGSANFEEDGPSAADYDPTLDMQEDERREGLRHAQPESKTVAPEAAPKAADDDDENFDMFADDFDEDKYATNAATAADAVDGGPEGGILEGDDREGYYKMRIGEVLNNRYQIQTTLGKGMFSGVVGAIDITTKTPIAIKIIRNNDALRKAGHTEIAILQKLNDADPENKRHIVKFERSFEFRGHLCMAFENLSMNLREVLRKFGNNVGINLSATRTYAYQIFVALAHMQKCSIIHADLKPDNILVS